MLGIVKTRHESDLVVAFVDNRAAQDSLCSKPLNIW